MSCKRILTAVFASLGLIAMPALTLAGPPLPLPGPGPLPGPIGKGLPGPVGPLPGPIVKPLPGPIVNPLPVPHKHHVHIGIGLGLPPIVIGTPVISERIVIPVCDNYQVSYRACSLDPWQTYTITSSRMRAIDYADVLRSLGYQVQVVEFFSR